MAAPDGGYGWVVVFAAFMQHIISLGVAYTLGVYLPYFVAAFNVPASTAAWIAALHLGMMFGSGPVAGWLMRKIGTSGVSFVGSMVAGVGCIGAAFASSVYVVIVSLGLICGFGTGFMFLSSVTAVSQWFDKKRPIATGVAVSGAGFGIFTFAPVVRLLLDHYGLTGALLIEGGFALQGCVFGLLLRPVPVPKKRIMKNLNLTVQIHTGFVATEEEIVPMEKDRRRYSTESNVEVSKPIIKQGMSDVFQNWIFWAFGVSQFLTFLSASGPLVFLYNRTVKDLEIDVMQAAYIVSAMGIANTVGRLLFGSVGNFVPRGRLFLLSGSVMMYGLATAISILGTSTWSVTLYAVIFGAGYGGMFALSTVVLVDLFGIELLGLIYGCIGIFRGSACIIGPPFGGWLISVTGYNHDVLFLLKGILGLVGGAVLLIIPLGLWFRRRKSTHI